MLSDCQTNPVAQQLYNIANHASLIHLKDGFTRMAFMADVNRFINQQLDVMRVSKSEPECKNCFDNLRREKENIALQDQMLRTKEANLYASIELTESNGIWHYVINGVGVVVSTLEVIAGIGIAFGASPTIAGSAFGALLITHGLNNLGESYNNLKDNRDDSVGLIRNGYIATAQFMGFSKEAGDLAYSVVDAGLSVYGLKRFVLKENSWKLFYYLNTDYVRNIKTMSKPALAIEATSDSLVIKSIIEKDSDSSKEK